MPPKGRSKYQGGECCAVCGASNASYNYDGLTCIPCKSFFIRSTGLSHSLLCRQDGKCQITKEKRDCNACRYRKCIEAGMKVRLVCPKGRYDDVVGQLKQKTDLVVRHLAPMLSLGFHFIGHASLQKSATKCAQFYANIDRHIVFISGSDSLYQHSMQVSFMDAIIDSGICYSKKEVLELDQQAALAVIIPHNFCRSVACFLDFVAAIPELFFLSTADKMSLIQDNFYGVTVLRAISVLHYAPAPSEAQIQLMQTLNSISPSHALRAQEFIDFYTQFAIPAFTAVNINLEELTLLQLIALFQSYEYCSDEGRETIRRAHFKYVNILKLYIKENYLELTEEQKIKRFRAFLDFLQVLKDFSNFYYHSLGSQVLNNEDRMMGTLSYDLHLRVFRN